MSEERILALNPVEGKAGTRIPKFKYDLVRKAILATLPKREPGFPFKELSAAVAKRLTAEQRETLGSVGWHTTTVKLDLEARGEIARVPGAKPQHLIRSGKRIAR